VYSQKKKKGYKGIEVKVSMKEQYCNCGIEINIRTKDK
jgi:hypothetical protein